MCRSIRNHEKLLAVRLDVCKYNEKIKQQNKMTVCIYPYIHSKEICFMTNLKMRMLYKECL